MRSLPFLAVALLLPKLLLAIPDSGLRIAGSMEGRAPEVEEPVILPLKRTDVSLDVVAGLVKAEVIQSFENTTSHRLEAIYAFPLPSRATVTCLEVRIDNRVIRSVVKEREEAKATYEKAKAEGKAAALLEQERPNLFTTSVANFGPGEIAQVKLTYIEKIDYREGAYSVAFPMTIGPRYLPKDGAGRPLVPDAARISPPVTPPWMDAGHRLTLEAKVRGIPVDRIRSRTHNLSVKSRVDEHHVELAEALVLPNKDFAMQIDLLRGESPELSMVRSEIGEDAYSLFSVFPPKEGSLVEAPPQARHRDVMFLIDTSGSMSGTSIEQAREGLRQCLGMLSERDRFTIVRFASDFTAFSPELQPATTERVHAAEAYLDSLVASGGTEMQSALSHVLDLKCRPGSLKMVIFLTDGAVGNEDTLFRLLDRKLGGRRLFTFGIGSAPNEHLMRKMGELGQGQSRFIRTQEDVGEVMADFFRTLSEPVLTDVTLAWEDRNGIPVEQIERYPSRCPDVFHERPLQVVAKLGKDFDGSLLVEGRLHGQPVSYRFALGDAQETEEGSVDKLFGRAQIDEWMYRHLQADGPEERTAAKQRIIDISLEHQLVSQFTSRVAVEEIETRDEKGNLITTRVPNAFPEGWNASQFFGTATTRTKHLILGALALGLALLLEVLRRRWALAPARAST